MKTRPAQTRQRQQNLFARPTRTAVTWLTVLLAATLHAAGPTQPGRDLADLSLEELMNETVTSVSKKAQRLRDAAAAISVLSNDDLRRSGATTLTEALRLVPGMEVAATNASQTAVSARGFNNVYANKLLVLLDGRAVYSPLFAGVFWDLQQTMMEDVDRIEVIRGPGAALWGANAVNGVINVVTRGARDTQGGLISGGGGDVLRTTGSVRYGGRLDARTFYRVYAGERSQDDSPLANGQPAGDNWSSRHGGFRVDHEPDAATHLTWQAAAVGTDFDDHASDARNLNTLARWTRAWAPDSATEAQIYYDHTDRADALRADTAVNTLDFTVQHSFSRGGRHNAIWGLGYRYIEGQVAATGPAILVRHGAFNQSLYSAFVQDEIKLVPEKFTLTLGTKVEHNDYTGLEVQPSVALVFKPAGNQTHWASISRAVRTPSVLEGRDVMAAIYGAPVVGPGNGIYLPTLTGNPDLASETLWAFEVGWRLQPNPRANVDVVVFYNDYGRLITPATVPRLVPGVPVGTAEMPWTNDLSGHTYGGEVSVTLSPVDHWRLTATCSLLVAKFHGSILPATTSEEGSPRQQFGLRSAFDFSPRLGLDGQFRSVGAIQGVAAYHTADLRLSYRPDDQFEFSLVGQNLLDPQHPEQANVPLAVTAEVPRGFHAMIRWRF